MMSHISLSRSYNVGFFAVLLSMEALTFSMLLRKLQKKSLCNFVGEIIGFLVIFASITWRNLYSFLMRFRVKSCGCFFVCVVNGRRVDF